MELLLLGVLLAVLVPLPVPALPPPLPRPAAEPGDRTVMGDVWSGSAGTRERVLLERPCTLLDMVMEKAPQVVGGQNTKDSAARSSKVKVVIVTAQARDTDTATVTTIL